MAGGAAKLPKWQARANLVPNRPQQISCQTKIFDRGKLHQDFSYFFFFDNADMYGRTKETKGRMKMKIGDHVHAEYANGEVVTGEVVNVRTFGDRTLLTVKCEQGYRSIYIDKCVKFLTLENAN